MLKKRKTKLEKEQVPAKSVDKCCCGGSECCSSAEDSFGMLVKSGMLAGFVKKNKGCWDHQSWLVLCAEIVQEGYGQIDFDQVGLALEREKADYFAKKK